MSVDCDRAGVKAAPVKARDLGILASTDLLAVEQASTDMVYRLPEAERRDLKERIESRKGLRRNLVAIKVLVGDRGVFRMTKAPESCSILDTAQAILAARIDRLPPDDKRLLQAASVTGRDVSFNLLQVWEKAIVSIPISLLGVHLKL